MKDYESDRRAASQTILLVAAIGTLLTNWSTATSRNALAAERPNILIAISDDQSYPHASAYGHPVIQTPAFDEVARRGILFHRAFTPAPGCSPMRAAFLTGRYIWEIREAGTHASSFPRDLPVFPDRLEEAGYAIGYTGKPWGPGNYRVSGWDRNPAGPAFNERKTSSPTGISSTDYAANFEAFLNTKAEDQPFCFWFGGHEPHRAFGKGLGANSGMNVDEVEVPGFLPDVPQVRHDLLDYFFEIQWFDHHLQRMLRTLEQRGLLDNTLVIVTSDNGMSFPRAKANLYEYGIHMPLAIAWPARFTGGRESYELVNLIDVTATIYEAAGVTPPKLSGHSLFDILDGHPRIRRDAVFSGRERHSSSRWNTLGYPCRCVRTEDYLYIRNFTPERWPAGAPQKYEKVSYDAEGNVVEGQLGPPHGAYHDIDACPTLDYMVEHRENLTIGPLLQLAVSYRPAEELYHVSSDPDCLTNLANDPAQQRALAHHRRLLVQRLTADGDLRQTDFAASHVWETYPRYSPLRWFPRPPWAEGMSIPEQPWLEQRRPRATAAE
ncbi:MAG: heparan N-sulfatase [Pirellulaceae bacterium]|nr:MAG: heparan N-sulfatase [Pirellulaceae bacterium]